MFESSAHKSQDGLFSEELLLGILVRAKLAVTIRLMLSSFEETAWLVPTGRGVLLGLCFSKHHKL
jgi:hypothetical protein